MTDNCRVGRQAERLQGLVTLLADWAYTYLP
jgi:hypothetical protein